MKIYKGEKKDFFYEFPNGSKWNYPYYVEINYDLDADADLEWVEHTCNPDPEKPRLRTVRNENVKTIEEAEALIAAWTPNRLKLLVSKPILWWCIDDAVYRRGWMTKSGRAKWRRIYFKNGWLFASLANSDEDWRHGLTRAWLFDMAMWQTHGRTHDRGKWWQPFDAPKEVEEHYSEMKKVKARLESPECPAPLRKWYEGML